MEETARFAAENGFDSFLTTLLISPYQNHELLIQTGQEAAEKYQVEFLYRDFRSVFRQGQEGPRAGALSAKNTAGASSARKTATRSGPKNRSLPARDSGKIPRVRLRRGGAFFSNQKKEPLQAVPFSWLCPRTTHQLCRRQQKAFASSIEHSEMINHGETEGLIREHCCFCSCGACNAWKKCSKHLKRQDGKMPFNMPFQGWCKPRVNAWF